MPTERAPCACRKCRPADQRTEQPAPRQATEPDWERLGFGNRYEAEGRN